jgi:TolB-like protein/DNA-binding winged helix-turn-helix (wHTH) protein/Flp pilus assembly protein TadD
MRPPANRLAQFGSFLLDLDQRVLSKDGSYVPLPPKDIETLVILVEARGRIVEKSELLEKVWPGTFVEEGNLTRHVFNLRQALISEDGSTNKFIETVPKRGYRLIAPVEYINTTASETSRVSISPPDAASVQADSPVLIQAEPLLSPAVKAPSPRLRLVLAAAALVAVAAAGYFVYINFVPRPTLASRRVMLAVLPVQNLSGNSSQDYVDDGLTEELIAQLGRLNPQQLGVIARTSSMAYKDTKKTIEQIGRELGVDYVLETSLRQSNGHLRFTAQLVRTSDQTHLWAQEYDKQAGDLISVQDEIGRIVADQIRVKLSPRSSDHVQPLRTVNNESHEAYLEGRYSMNRRSADGLTKGIAFFQEAIEKDPSNARAYAGLADSYNLMVFYGYLESSLGIVHAKEAAERAIAIDDSLAEGHAALAYVNFMWLWDWAVAEQEFRRAIELNQNYSTAHHWFALYLAAMNRPQEAAEEIKKAEILDPRSPIVKSAAGWIYYFARQPQLAGEECRSALQLDPDFMVAHSVLGLSYEDRGEYDQAISEFRRSIALSGIQQPTYLGYLGHAYAVSGKHDEAREVLRELDESAKVGHVGLLNKAVIYAGLGDKEEAIKTLQQAASQNDASRVWLRVNPQLESLRSDSRFTALLPKSRHPF